MLPEHIFQIELLLGYLAMLLLFRTYLLPRLRTMDHFRAQRAIAMLHSFRFFGMAFLVSGVVGTALPMRFAGFAAWGDLTAGLLAFAALLTVRIRPLFWAFVAAFNVAGAVDLIGDYYHATRLNLGAVSGQLGAMYVIPVLVVPLLMITHIASLYWLARPTARPAVA